MATTIKIIEVPYNGPAKNMEEGNRPEDIKRNKAQTVKETTSSFYERYKSATDIKGKIQTKIARSFQKKIDTNSKNIGSDSNATSGESNISSDANLKAGAAVGLALKAGSDLLTMGKSVFNMALMNTRYGKFGGNAVAANKLNNVQAVTGTVGNIAGDVGTYGALGAAFGPVGMAIGAAVGLAVGVSKRAMQVAEEAREIALQQQEWQAEAVKSLERMGYNGSR